MISSDRILLQSKSNITLPKKKDEEVLPEVNHSDDEYPESVMSESVPKVKSKPKRKLQSALVSSVIN